jgi:3-oxoacyl-[acyl-carrier protein] reductase
MDLGIAGKVALLTGASSGIGYACAEALAGEGVRVAICARGREAIEAAARDIAAKTGGEIVAFVADVSRAEDIDRLLADVSARLGTVDILLANNGGPPRGGFDVLSDEMWQEGFDVTVMSTVRLIRGVLPAMKDKQWGRVLTVVSSSVRQPVDNLELSNSLRPGIVGLFKSLAVTMGKHNVLFNCIAPGRIMTKRFLAGSENAGLTEEQYAAKHAATIPLGRIGRADEFASVVTFLASERASYVTGATIIVDGGMIRSLH